MRILRLRAYYNPELTASNHMSDDMDEAYVQNRIININYTPMPTRGVSDDVRKVYKKKKVEVTHDGYVIVHRFPMFREKKNTLQRAFRYFCCGVMQYYYGTKEKDIDVVHSGSTPPTQGIVSVLIAKNLSRKSDKKISFIYNLQDIFPDSMVNSGMTKKGSIIWKIGRKIENYTYKNADQIIVISEGFKRNIMKKGVPEEKIKVISNWIDIDSVHPVERKDNKLIEEFGLDPTKFIVVYAGNFGAAQGADIILKAAQELKEIKDIQFVIFGGGAYFEEAKKEAEKLDNVFIHGLMPQNRISEVYSLGDVALITCKKGTGKAGMPSKTWSIMACNTPIIASFDTDSDLAEVIKDSGAGFCIKPESVQSLKEQIIKMYKDGFVCDNLRDYVYVNASKEQCTKKYLEVIKVSGKK